MMTDDERYMRLALEEARRAGERDEVPIGAVIVCRGRVVGRGHNLTEALTDVTAHAEMQAVTAASDTIGGKYLTECTLYVTVEPCLMCAGALAWSQIARVVYGASDDKRGYHTLCEQPFHKRTEVTGGVLADECAQLMQDFFKRKRVNSKKTIAMNKLKLTLLFVGLCLSLTGTACRPAAAPQSIEQMEDQPQATVVQVRSDKMGRDIAATVVVPEQYHDPDLQEEQFPVVYLLHGADGSHRDWPAKANLEDLASEYSLIIVCPDGQDSWYFDSPVDPKMQFETFISGELVSYVDHHYRTLPDRRYRAITGLSMGGHGALWNAWRHADVFGACGSMSGGVDISQFPDRWKLDRRLGAYSANTQRWKEHSVVSLVSTLQDGRQAIIIDDGAQDFFYKVNCELHAALMERGVGHDFIIRPGNHSWTYWVNALDYQMLFFAKYFSEN